MSMLLLEVFSRKAILTILAIDCFDGLLFNAPVFKGRGLVFKKPYLVVPKTRKMVLGVA